MDTTGLDLRLVEHWLKAGEDLGIRVTAPAQLRDGEGKSFVCEAFVHDFGAPQGGAVISPRTERRVRQSLRSLGDDFWYSVSGSQRPSAYERKHFIRELFDWGWFGKRGQEPEWYSAIAD